ncbi:hypothetical protein BFW01_g4880 [Lasiodiplodia theobromae]|nr:hypothetical protein BFW01_g4880 [Lasiodiplodia theobromae]
MADPCSIIGLVVGVISLALDVSGSLHEIASNMRGAPKEVAVIAIQLDEVIEVMTAVRTILEQEQQLFTPELFKQVQSAFQRFRSVNQQIKQTIPAKSMKENRWGSFKWAFSARGKVKSFMDSIEAIKSFMNLVLQLATLSVVTKQAHTTHETVLHAEKIAGVYAVVERVVEKNRQIIERQHNANKHQPADTESDKQNPRIQVGHRVSEDAATWLYRLIFETSVQEIVAAPKTSARSSPNHDINQKVDGKEEAYERTGQATIGGTPSNNETSTKKSNTYRADSPDTSASSTRNGSVLGDEDFVLGNGANSSGSQLSTQSKQSDVKVSTAHNTALLRHSNTQHVINTLLSSWTYLDHCKVMDTKATMRRSDSGDFQALVRQSVKEYNGQTNHQRPKRKKKSKRAPSNEVSSTEALSSQISTGVVSSETKALKDMGDVELADTQSNTALSNDTQSSGFSSTGQAGRAWTISSSSPTDTASEYHGISIPPEI